MTTTSLRVLMPFSSSARHITVRAFCQTPPPLPVSASLPLNVGLTLVTQLGSSKATWMNYIKKLGSAMTPQTLGGMKKSDLVSALETESETLQNITDYFVPMMRQFCIFFFWEQEQTNLKLLGRDYIVVQESAAPVYDDTERAGIAADHRSMVKFEDPSSQGFRMVIEALSRYCEDAPAVIHQRRASAARALELERHRMMAETLGSFRMGEGATPPAPARVQSSGLSSLTIVDRSNTFRSISGPED